MAIQLRDIWNTAEEGVALVSATLYAIGEDGEYHCDYARASLNVSIARAATLPPVREPHITTIPFVHTLGAGCYDRFIPGVDKGEGQRGVPGMPSWPWGSGRWARQHAAARWC